MMKTNREYMQRAMKLAFQAKGQTSPNPLVGAVIVKNNRIIAQGWHKRCGSDHAEVMALKKAGRRAKGAKLIVTLEPCFHTGRTAPCVDKIIASGIKEIAIGMKDPNRLTNGRSIRKLTSSGIKAHVGLLQRDLEKMNEPFLKYVEHNIPFITAKCAQTLDGKIATASGDSKWITSSKTRAFTHRLRDDFDAIMVGVNTVTADNPGLNASRRTKRLKKVIVDSSLRISGNAKLFKQTRPQDCYIATTRKASRAKIKTFQNKGVNIIECPLKAGRVNLKWLARQLAQHEITNVLLEGGSQLIGAALKDNLVDKMQMIVAPKIVGDAAALSSIQGLPTKTIKAAIRLKNITVQSIGDDIFIEGYVYRNR